ncbi:MAG: hypothetical protein F4Z36_03820 [Acidimicrobiia bacterium]|nr:hypothetical protein [Acidimicrobiia bacterium]
MTARPQSHPVPAPAPELTVLSGTRRFRWRPIPWIIYTLVAVVAFLSFIFLRTAVDEAAYEISVIQTAIDKELARQAYLEEQKRALQSPGEVLPLAEEMLGMVLPSDVIPVSPPVAPDTEGSDPGRVDSG